MAIRMRRGNEADFDPSKMLPGEWAVSTDTKYVRMCFSPGIVLRMATYEAFESDMAEMRKILSECQSIQTAVELIQQNVTNSELVIENYVKEAKQYRDEAEQFRNEAFSTTPEGYEDLVKNVSDNTVKIDTVLEKAGLKFDNTVKGSNIHLTDSADSNVVALELYGKTEQNAYTGKNLLDCSGLTEQTINGGKFTPVYDENGSLLYVNVNGTFTAQTSYYLMPATPFDKGNYIFSGCPTGGSGTTYSIYNDVSTGSDTGNGKELNFTDTTNVRLRIVIGKGYTANNLKFYPMISVEGGEYEPYVGSKPSPSPSYPQEIKSVKGKNLLDCRGLTEQTVNGGTFTPVYDSNGNLEYINVNGTFTANATYIISKLPTLESGKLIMSGCPSSGNTTDKFYLEYSNNVNYAYADTGSGTEIEKFDYSIYTNAEIKIQVRSGYTAKNIKFYPMIRSASIKDDTYVPYGLLRIKTHGINQFDISAPTKENEILNSDGTFSTNGGFNSYRLKLTDTITISYEKDVNFDVLRYGLEIDGVITRYTISETELTIQKDSADAVWISIAKTNAQKNIMINTGTIALPYQPYQSSEITLSEPIELNGFNGVYDVVTSEGVTRRFAEVVFDGSDDENWGYYISNNVGFLINLDLVSTIKIPTTTHDVPNVLCSIAKVTSRDDLSNSDNNFAVAHNANIALYSSQFNNEADWRTFLQSNPMTVLYELATPTTEALQTDFTALKTFYPETYVSNDADCDMSITYTADAKNYIDNKIALLTTALYNNI